MTDLISRQDAIDAIDDAIDANSPQWAILRTKIGFLPSAEAVSREDYHNLLMATNDIDRALREYQAKDENPSAEAEWIPCSERLPSEDGRYLVTYPLSRWQNNWISVMHYGKPSMPNCEVKGKCFYVSDDEWGDVVYDNIIAWMPLPKPYREESEVEE